MHSLDQAKAEQFAQKMLTTLNAGALSMMISLGHRSRLFETLADGGASFVTSQELAQRAGLQERYVREWLAAMVMGGIVDYDRTQKTYRLPPEHAAFLTPAATPNNMAVGAQFISVLAGVEDDVLACFKNGGGVPYERYHRFHEVMAEESGQTVLSALVERILPLVPGLPQRLTAGIDVLDIGCGSGRAMVMLAARFPKSRFVGYDLSREAIAAARQAASARQLANLDFQVRDLSDLDKTAASGGFDLITAFDAIHDQAKPGHVLRGIARSLKDDGVFLMQDIHGSSHLHENLSHPLAAYMYSVSCMHCMTVSLAQNGDGLGSMWGREKAQELLREAGFGRIRIERLEHDIINDYYIAQR